MKLTPTQRISVDVAREGLREMRENRAGEPPAYWLGALSVSLEHVLQVIAEIEEDAR